jgi:hypothetical protein
MKIRDQKINMEHKEVTKEVIHREIHRLDIHLRLTRLLLKGSRQDTHQHKDLQQGTPHHLELQLTHHHHVVVRLVIRQPMELPLAIRQPRLRAILLVNHTQRALQANLQAATHRLHLVTLPDNRPLVLLHMGPRDIRHMHHLDITQLQQDTQVHHFPYMEFLQVCFIETFESIVIRMVTSVPLHHFSLRRFYVNGIWFWAHESAFHATTT